MVEQCDGMSMHSFSGTGLLVFSDDMTEDRGQPEEFLSV